MTKPPRNILSAWLSLLLLLLATLGMAYVPLGSGNLLVALTIATAKAAIVLFVFMNLLRGPSLIWIFAGVGVFWLTLLFGLSWTDYATRSGFPPHP